MFKFLFLLLFLSGCNALAPTPTLTPTLTPTPTPTPTLTPTPTPTPTPTLTPTLAPAQPMVINFNPNLNAPYTTEVRDGRTIMSPAGFVYSGVPINVVCGLGACRIDMAWFSGFMGYSTPTSYLFNNTKTYLLKLVYEVGCFSSKYIIDDNAVYLIAMVGSQLLDFRTVNARREALWTFKVRTSREHNVSFGAYVPNGVCEQHSFITIRAMSLELLPQDYQTVPFIVEN